MVYLLLSVTIVVLLFVSGWYFRESKENERTARYFKNTASEVEWYREFHSRIMSYLKNGRHIEVDNDGNILYGENAAEKAEHVVTIMKGIERTAQYYEKLQSAFEKHQDSLCAGNISEPDRVARHIIHSLAEREKERKRYMSLKNVVDKGLEEEVAQLRHENRNLKQQLRDQ